MRWTRRAANEQKHRTHSIQAVRVRPDAVRAGQRDLGPDRNKILKSVKKASTESNVIERPSRGQTGDKTSSQWFESMSPDTRALFDSLEGFITSLGDDVIRKDLKLYVAFKRLRNFACVGFKKEAFFLWLQLDPDTVPVEEGFSRDVREIGHWGTGDYEVVLRNHADLDKVKPLLQKAYEG